MLLYNRIDVWNEFYDRLNELYSTQQSEVQNAYKTHNCLISS